MFVTDEWTKDWLIARASNVVKSFLIVLRRRGTRIDAMYICICLFSLAVCSFHLLQSYNCSLTKNVSCTIPSCPNILY